MSFIYLFNFQFSLSLISLISTDYEALQKIDPLLELQKHAFVLKLKLNHSYNANMLEHLLENLEEFPYGELPVFSILQLLMQLKNCNINPEPLTVGFKLFYLERKWIFRIS